MFPWNTVVTTQVAFGLVPEVLDPVDMIVLLGKVLSMIDPVMLKFRNIKFIIGFIAISIDHAVRLHVFTDKADQRL